MEYQAKLEALGDEALVAECQRAYAHWRDLQARRGPDRDMAYQDYGQVWSTLKKRGLTWTPEESIMTKKQAMAEAIIAAVPDDKIVRLHSEARTIQEGLRALFPEESISWKPQAVSGNRAMAVAYIDARDVQQRLDDVVGVMGWSDTYIVRDSGAVICRLSLRIEGEWVAKEDVGSLSDQPDAGDQLKAAFSDALKRAAVKFGIGRYLYSLPKQWVDFDPQKKRFVREPSLPAWAIPQAPANPETPDDLAAWKNWLALSPDLDAFNEMLDRDYQECEAEQKKRVWPLISEYARKRGWKRNDDLKKFI